MSDPADLCRCGGKGKCLWCAIERGLEQGPFFDVAKEPWLERIRGVPSSDSIPEEHRMPRTFLQTGEELVGNDGVPLDNPDHPLVQPGPLSNVAFDEMVGPDGTTRDVDAAIVAAGLEKPTTWTFKNGNKLVFGPPLPGDADYRSSWPEKMSDAPPELKKAWLEGSWDLASDIPAEGRYTMHTRHSDGTFTEMELTRAQYEKVKATMARLAPPKPADDYEALGYPETSVRMVDSAKEDPDLVFWGMVDAAVDDLPRWSETWMPTDKKNDSST